MEGGGDLRQTEAVEEEGAAGPKVEGSQRFAVKAAAAVGGLAGLAALILCSTVIASRPTSKTMQPQLRRTTDMYYGYYADYDPHYTDYDTYYADGYGVDAYAYYYGSYWSHDRYESVAYDYAPFGYGEYYDAVDHPDAVAYVRPSCILPPTLQQDIASMRGDFKATVTSLSAEEREDAKRLVYKKFERPGAIDSESGIGNPPFSETTKDFRIAKVASAIATKLFDNLQQYHGRYNPTKAIKHEVLCQLFDGKEPAEQGSARPCEVHYGYYLDYSYYYSSPRRQQ